MRGVIAAVAAAALAAGCGQLEQDPWEGWIYPTGDLTQHITLGTFPTYATCRFEAQSRLRDMNATEAGLFECGSYCVTRPGMTVKTCQETRDD